MKKDSAMVREVREMQQEMLSGFNGISFTGTKRIDNVQKTMSELMKPTLNPIKPGLF